MKIQKSAVNLLLAGEGLLLVVVLVFGLITGAAGLLKTPQEGANNQVGKNTESVNSEEGNQSEANSEEDRTENLKWTVPENYVEERITFSETVEVMLANMSTEQMVAQLFAVTPEELTGYDQVTVFGNASKQAFDTYPVGAIVYSAHNYQNDRQMKNLIEGAMTYSSDVYGRVLWTVMQDSEGTELQVRVDTVNKYGLNTLLGATAEFSDMQASGKHAVIGSFPGVGEGASLEEMNAGTFVAYDSCVQAGAKVLMVSNTAVVSITGNALVPCTMSSRTVGLLRQRMGYQGVLMTEDFSSEAFVALYGKGAACVDAIKAGMDMIYKPASFTESYTAVLEAVNNGNISADRLHNAVGRILTAKGV